VNDQEEPKDNNPVMSLAMNALASAFIQVMDEENAYEI